MATRKQPESDRVSPSQSVRIEDLIRDLRQLLHNGYTRIEVKDAIIYHYDGRPADALRNLMKGSID